mmetsp:Transcript_76728/g.217431  ORF Transcript_76728/g.217431 Transcript_76728/m.217431 type:complete len:209 (+) Transcript_76728:587-1213(+)
MHSLGEVDEPFPLIVSYKIKEVDLLLSEPHLRLKRIGDTRHLPSWAEQIYPGADLGILESHSGRGRGRADELVCNTPLVCPFAEHAAREQWPHPAIRPQGLRRTFRGLLLADAHEVRLLVLPVEERHHEHLHLQRDPGAILQRHVECNAQTRRFAAGLPRGRGYPHLFVELGAVLGGRQETAQVLLPEGPALVEKQQVAQCWRILPEP